MKRILVPILFLVLATMSTAPVPAAAESCAATRPSHLFRALEQVDVAGESRLRAVLEALAARRGWSDQQWDAYAQVVTSTPEVSAVGARRDQIITRIFSALAEKPRDCAALDALRAEAVALEQRQWDMAVREVEAQLARDAALRDTH